MLLLNKEKAYNAHITEYSLVGIVMKLIPITVIHPNGNRQIININLEQIVAVFKEGNSHRLIMSSGPEIRAISREDYNIIMNWNDES